MVPRMIPAWPGKVEMNWLSSGVVGAVNSRQTRLIQMTLFKIFLNGQADWAMGRALSNS